LKDHSPYSLRLQLAGKAGELQTGSGEIIPSMRSGRYGRTCMAMD
jgi:hypothetical protein